MSESCYWSGSIELVSLLRITTNYGEWHDVFLTWTCRIAAIRYFTCPLTLLDCDGMFSDLFEPPDAELYEDECIKWTKLKKLCLNQLVYRLKWFNLCLFSQYKDICSRNSMTICSSLFRLVLAITALLDVLICAKIVK